MNHKNETHVTTTRKRGHLPILEIKAIKILIFIHKGIKREKYHFLQLNNPLCSDFEQFLVLKSWYSP